MTTLPTGRRLSRDLDLPLLGGAPDAPALITPQGTTTYAELASAVRAMAALLGPERRLVLLEARNDVRTVVTYLAALAGHHPVLLVGEGANARADEIHAAVAARAPKYMPGFVDRGYSKAFIDAIQDHLYAMTDEAADRQRRDAATVVQNFRERLAAHEGQGAPPLPPVTQALGRDHPDRRAISTWLQTLAADLQQPSSGAFAQVEDIKREFLDSPAVAAMFGAALLGLDLLF